jgi:Cys-tRNA(Pro)/Cys-tRNA(Cys) deacylase
MPIVNNVTRLLDAKKVPYRALELSVEKHGAVETASLLGVDPASVYKTIVVSRPKGKPILAVIPGPNRVDLKLLAAAMGEKKVSLPTEREAEALTGLQAGGISPLALVNKGFQVVIDAAAHDHPEIHVSGGQRGLNIRLPVQALADVSTVSLGVEFSCQVPVDPHSVVAGREAAQVQAGHRRGRQSHQVANLVRFHQRIGIDVDLPVFIRLVDDQPELVAGRGCEIGYFELDLDWIAHEQCDFRFIDLDGPAHQAVIAGSRGEGIAAIGGGRRRRGIRSQPAGSHECTHK